ncbi:hypothetical protein ACE0DR_22320 [Azotobacter sp. CWF10]
MAAAFPGRSGAVPQTGCDQEGKSDRVGQYNQLLRIEEALQGNAYSAESLLKRRGCSR